MAPTAVIVDDHAGFRAEAAGLLRAAGYQVVGSCPDARSGLATIAASRPDLVLLDVQLSGADGFAVLAQIGPGPTVVLVSTREAADYGSRVAGSRAAGFLTKADLSVRALAAVVARR
ncbi:response regulator [Micromonosporaceae bacterium Da 78-11]